MNEAALYDQVGHEILKQLGKVGPGAEFWWVFDSTDEASPDLGSRGRARIGTSAEVLNVDGRRCWRLAKGYRTDGFPTDRE